MAMKKTVGMLLLGLLSSYLINAQTRTDREMDGLKGQVKSVRLEVAEVLQKEGKPVEKPGILHSVTTYDEKGNKVEELRYNFKGSLDERMVFARDDKGNQTETIYKADGTMDSKWVYTYDAGGNMTGGAQYDSDGALRLKMVRTFDEHGKLIEGAMYNADGSLMNKTLFKYDAEGKQAEDAVYDASGVLMQKFIRSNAGYTAVLYDNDGTVRYKDLSRSPSLESDSHGNWIKSSTPRTVTQGDKTEEIIAVEYRTIIYY